jgi:hypothetical protein
MIVASENFLTHAEAIRVAIDDAIRAIPDEGGPIDRPAMQDALGPANRAILIAEGDVSMLAVVFPHRKLRELQVFTVASDYTGAMRALTAQFASVTSRSDVDKDQLGTAMREAGYYHGQFSALASEQIWRRWFLRASPWEQIRHRARTLRR